MSGKYDDIIHLSRPVSTRHTPMSRYDRAAQFSPFAALTGYDAAILETARLTDARMEPSEHRRLVLDENIRLVMERLETQPELRITYFVPDLTKSGGSYVTEQHRIKKVDLYQRILLTAVGDVIPMDNIWELEIL